ncbi:amino acid permease [Haloplasma contractile]|uniref:Amino acid permease protein n=1 Tax=Haloplasma contractile SSD-17B TaxID=1033810 RepID=U2EAT1_9MOLU|nr:amino acid permease [Haloplasma contractile]ERJ11921.1 Amino acid permease protein [Haloplasma contractile SSD-17B]
MRHDHIVKQRVQHRKEKNIKKGKKPHLTWRQLTMIGIGSVIGAGYFLGTGLSISTAGPAILLVYLIGGLTAFLVFCSLAEMTVNIDTPGSFRGYAKMAFGHCAGFTIGWMYWLSGILVIASELVALSTFTQYWFPSIPLWIFSIIYAALGFLINIMGLSNFSKIESIFALIKMTTLIAFTVFGALLLFNVITPQEIDTSTSQVFESFMPNGVIGMWSSLVFVLFTFAGVAFMGVASSELKHKRDIPKAGIAMFTLLLAFYTIPLFFIFVMVPWTEINDSNSPFVTALSAFNIPYIDSIFNIIIISAAFSTMVGAIFSITKVLVSLANDNDAPKILAVINKRGVATKALLLSALVLIVTVVLVFLLPDTIYEYVTTSAGVILIINWIVIIASQFKLRPTYKDNDTFKAFCFPYDSYLALCLIFIALTGALVERNQRIGVFMSIGFILIILLCYRFIYRKKGGGSPK